jgi:putative ABC transport system permease protein
VAQENGGTAELRCSHASIDERFLDLYGIPIVAGRNLRAGERNAALVNETLVRAMGWTSPLGKSLDLLGRVKMTVVGVVKDFHFSSLHSRVGPLILGPLRGGGSYLSVRLKAGSGPPALAGLGEAYRRRIKGEPFEARFLDDIFDGLYRKETRTGAFVLVFACLAVFLSGLGLSGLSARAVESRTKEIGVRRVLGASPARLLAFLNGSFLAPVLLATGLALPAAFWIMSRWLRGFAYHISPGLGLFVLSVFMTLAVALLAVGYQSVRAARANPVEALRHE